MALRVYDLLWKSLESIREDLDAETVASGANSAAMDFPFLLSAANVAPSSSMAGTYIFRRSAVPQKFAPKTTSRLPSRRSAVAPLQIMKLPPRAHNSLVMKRP